MKGHNLKPSLTAFHAQVPFSAPIPCVIHQYWSNFLTHSEFPISQWASVVLVRVDNYKINCFSRFPPKYFALPAKVSHVRRRLSQVNSLTCFFSFFFITPRAISVKCGVLDTLNIAFRPAADNKWECYWVRDYHFGLPLLALEGASE